MLRRGMAQLRTDLAEQPAEYGPASFSSMTAMSVLSSHTRSSLAVIFFSTSDICS